MVLPRSEKCIARTSVGGMFGWHQHFKKAAKFCCSSIENNFSILYSRANSCSTSMRSWREVAPRPNRPLVPTVMSHESCNSGIDDLHQLIVEMSQFAEEGIDVLGDV
jgi:hypothetical protein